MYRALYRKWRPQRFADVVGQTAIVTALQNQISAGRIGHAYLFTGTRGTGKTTCAKIFAKAVNCLDTSSPDPCGECEICKGIDSGSVMDIIEMDAASNNGVDDIRDLRDEVAYLPSVCKYKVYIIDEVHMLSTAAFNALLKTMEEPPEHVIFILATTEVQKVPVTILSRCQRYDFTRITADDIAGRLLYVAGQEKIELDENAAQLIGRLADGAMRDALSILDTCAAHGLAQRTDTGWRLTPKGFLVSNSIIAALQEALGALKVTDTLTGSINPGVENTDLTMINLADDEHTLFTFEFYETGILAYRSENNQEFYVCEPASLASFYQTVEQICSQYSSTPASLALMDYGALNSMTISSTTGTSRKDVGLIRDHAQTLFSFLQQLHVSKGSVREESVMFSRPEYHADIEFASGMVIRLDINSGSLLIDGGDGVILHYTMIGDSNMDRVRAEFERLIND